MQKARSLDLNKDKFALFYVLNYSLPICVVNLLFYKSKGLSFKEIMFLEAITSIVTILLEIPSGVLADTYGRKNLLLIGQGFSMLALFLILISKKYVLFILSAIFFGISDSAISGSDIALIYDYFKFNLEENIFEEYFARINSYKFIVFSITTLVGGSIFVYNCNLVVILSIILQFMSFIAIILFKENFERKNLENFYIKDSFIEDLKILKRKELFGITVVFLIMTIVIATLNQFTQEYLVEINFDLRYLGILYFIFNIISAVGSRFYKIINKVNITNVILIFSIFLFALAFDFNLSGILILIIFRFFSSGILPILNTRFNEFIPSDERASIISYKNLLISLSFIIFDPINGAIVDYKNVHFLYLMCSLVLFLYFLKRALSRKKYEF